MANLLGVLIARTRELGVEVRRNGVASAGKRLVAYTSAAAHGCIAQAMDLSGLGSAALHVIPTNDCHQIDIDALDAAIAQDRNAGLTPFLVVGTAGTVDTGAIDDLAALAAIARREKLWFHVDGAIGALAIMAPDIAPRLAGIQAARTRSRSISTNGGRCLTTPALSWCATARCIATLSRRRRRICGARRAGWRPAAQWPCDFGPDLSRGFRALKTWFTLKVYGTDALGAMISRTCELARYLEIKIATARELELLAPVSLNIVCFRYRGDDPDRLNAKIVADLHESGIAAPSTTMIGNRLAIRAAIVNHRTEPRDIDAMLKAVLRIRRRGDNKLCRLRQKERRVISANTNVAIANEHYPATPIGLPALCKMAFDGLDLAPVWNRLVHAGQGAAGRRRRAARSFDHRPTAGPAAGSHRPCNRPP